MKNLFILILLLFISNISFANSDVKNKSQVTIINETINHNINFKHLYVDDFQLCIYRIEYTVIIGGETYTQSYTHIGVSASDVDCKLSATLAYNRMKEIARF